MARLTKKLKQEYIDNKGKTCPHCGSKKLSLGEVIGELNGKLFVDVFCENSKCKKHWVEEYSLSGVESRRTSEIYQNLESPCCYKDHVDFYVFLSDDLKQFVDERLGRENHSLGLESYN